MKNLIQFPQWKILTAHQRIFSKEIMRNLFAADPKRFTRFSLIVGDILLDYSRHWINDQTIPLLCKLAIEASLPERIEALFIGKPVNVTENRPALHTALRDKEHPAIWINDQNLAIAIMKTQQKLYSFVNQIHTGQRLGVTGKKINSIVNIGIGGSYWGPVMCIQALKDFTISNLQFYFISTVDSTSLYDVLSQINPETTLFLISSKSFQTLETLTNTHTIREWVRNKLGDKALNHHFVAITAAVEKAHEFGINKDCIFPVLDYVGGRYSIWSAVGLPVMLMIGTERFNEFLDGAYEMDKHFRTADFNHNMPVLLALLGIWYINFFRAEAHAIIPYAYRLRYLVPYLQQLDMESNGKQINNRGYPISDLTGPIIFGEEGCIGQHAYHQLLHQGQHLIPVDFILTALSITPNDNHQDIEVASGLSQAQALMYGRTHEEAYESLIKQGVSSQRAEKLAAYQVTPGNRPSSILFLKQITPKTLGALLALYEHKIFVQASLWGINPFDQWGVELGKQLLPDILEALKNAKTNKEVDANISELIKYYKKFKS